MTGPTPRSQRSGDQFDQSEVERSWAVLREAIGQIHSQNASQLSFEELYRSAYNMVLNRHGEFLYKAVSDILSKHMDEIADRVASTSGSSLVPALALEFKDHKTTLSMIRDILMYMDRNFVKPTGRTAIFEVGMDAFSSVVLLHPRVKDRLTAALVENIYADQSGLPLCQRKEMIAIISTFATTSDAYAEIFESPLLNDAKAFYEAEAARYIADSSVTEYLDRAESRLLDEQQRLEDLGARPSTFDRMQRVIDDAWVGSNYRRLLAGESGLPHLLKANRRDDIGKMFRLFVRNDTAIAAMSQVLSECITRSCVDALAGISQRTGVADSELASELVTSLLELRKQYSGYLTEQFNNSRQLQLVIKQAFETGMNDGIIVINAIVHFLDGILRQPNSSPDSAVIDSVVSLFRLIQDKDIFESVYRQMMSLRFLSIAGDLSAEAAEAERHVVSRLKAECGPAFVSRLEGMITDLLSSIDLNAAHSLPVKVRVLTCVVWPISPPREQLFILPQELEVVARDFESFYLQRHTGRKLSWLLQYGSVDLVFNAPTERYLLQASPLQAAVLLLFCDAQSLSFTEVAEKTKAPAVDLKRTVLNLVNKVKLLNRTSDSMTDEAIDDSDNIEVNTAFESRKKAVKLCGNALRRLPLQQSSGGNDLPQVVEEDRKHILDSVLVRVMKSRKRLDHNNLVAEVVKMVGDRFLPTPAVIKQRIELLIEREFLKREDNDRSFYEYLA